MLPLFYANSNHAGGSHRATVMEQKTEALSTFDQPRLENAGGRGSRAVLWMAGNADGPATQAPDPVVPILRLHIDQRAARKTRELNTFR